MTAAKDLFYGLLGLALIAAACTRSGALRIHYLPQFVAGSHDVLAPVAIAIAPIGGLASASRLHAGAIYDSDGKPTRELYADGLSSLLSGALERAFSDAGAKPTVLDSAPRGNLPPRGSDFLIACDLDQLEVNKHFTGQMTVHGEVFTMAARARLRCTVAGRDGRIVWSGETSGAEDEPPAPVGNETFLPLETEPDESLSVALSRAVGNLMIDHKFGAALSRRSATPDH